MVNWGEDMGNRRFTDRERGFTIVELLIVIVVIAILAAITIVAYNGIQNRAKTSAIQADLNNTSKAIELYKIASGTNNYPTDIAQVNPKPSNGNNFDYIYDNTSNPTRYCLTVNNGTTFYSISSTTGIQPNGCTITNLVVNPSLESNLTGWISSNETDFTLSRVQVSGKWVARGLRNTSNAAAIRLYDIPMAVTNGSTYTVSATITASTAQQVRLDVRSGLTSTAIFSAYANVAANTPQRVSATGTVDASTVHIALFLQSGGGAGSTVSMDEVMFTQGSTLYSYSDGSYPNWNWSGTANASTSSGPAS